MCLLFGYHVLLSLLLGLLISTLFASASSYMRTHGAKELWPYFRIRCNQRCMYGYLTDVEGNQVCLCYDPCQNVRCFGSTTCQVELPKACHADNCRPKATCRDTGRVPQKLPLPLAIPQADDAATTSLGTSRPGRCLLPVTDEAKKCRKMRMRWYFDEVTGTCLEFLGCKTMGNNFRGKRGCEKTCVIRKPFKNRSKYQAPQADDANVTSSTDHTRDLTSSACLLPAVRFTTGCKRVRRRWYFDKASGSCRKLRSCPAPGNSFSKKRHCRRKCLGKKGSRRKEEAAYISSIMGKSDIKRDSSAFKTTW